MCDPVNHTRFPKEDHLLDWVCRDKHSNKGVREEYAFIFSSHLCLGLSNGVPQSESSKQHYARIYLYFAPDTHHTP
jgi:hypothetical protein